MYNDDGIKICGKYTVMYDGCIFFGDSDGLNMHDYDDFEEVNELIDHYGDMIIVKDNEYGVTWMNGAWQ